MPLEHRFSGYSVWLEPEESHAGELLSVIKILANKCGSGCHFMPHVTLLYNFDLFEKATTEEDNNCNFDAKGIAKVLLSKVHAKYKAELLKKYPLTRAKEESNKKNDSVHNYGPIPQDHSLNIDSHCLTIEANELFFFHYKKEMDGGKGFGALIPLIIYELKRYPELKLLQNVTLDLFPGDERHKNVVRSSQTIESNSDDDASGKFKPHLALCYASEDQTWLQDWVEERNQANNTECDNDFLLKPMKFKYMSVWKTEGTLADWELVYRYDLESTPEL